MLGKICRSWQRTLELAYIIGLPPYCDDGDHHHHHHPHHHDNRDEYDVHGDHDNHEGRGVGQASLLPSQRRSILANTRQYWKPNPRPFLNTD